jgi:hypothetical protein
MGISAAVIGGSLLLGANEQRKARKDAERAAAEERAAVEALQREIKAEAAAPEAAMPSPNDAATKAAKRRSITAQMRRRGRASTILTGDPVSDPIGG